MDQDTSPPSALATALLRLIIIALAAGGFWILVPTFDLSFETLADPLGVRWFNLLNALGNGVVAPALCLGAIVLAVMNRRLGLALWMLAGAAAVYAAPIVAFAVAVMIYGF